METLYRRGDGRGKGKGRKEKRSKRNQKQKRAWRQCNIGAWKGREGRENGTKIGNENKGDEEGYWKEERRKRGKGRRKYGVGIKIRTKPMRRRETRKQTK